MGANDLKPVFAEISPKKIKTLLNNDKDLKKRLPPNPYTEEPDIPQNFRTVEINRNWLVFSTGEIKKGVLEFHIMCPTHSRRMAHTLTTAAINQLRTEGIETLITDCPVCMPDVTNFIRKHGFYQTGKVFDEHYDCDSIKFRKRL